MALCLPKFVSRTAAEAADGATRCQDGTFAVFDVVGFTTLSERLERHGRVGAELTTVAVNGVLGPAVQAVLAVGGDVMTFGGDAISVYVSGAEHERRAAICAAEIQRAVHRHGRLATDAGAVHIKVSGGMHRGAPTLVCSTAGDYSPTFVTGAVVTTAVELNAAAGAGVIVLSADLAEHLPPSWVTRDADGRARLRLGAAARPGRREWEPTHVSEAPHQRLSPVLRRALTGAAEAEHRPAAVAFVSLPGTDHLPHDELARRATALVAEVDALRERFGICSLDTDVGADQIRLMLTAGAPVLSDRDEERLLLALHQLAGRGLGVKAGANRGRVYAGEVGHPLRATYTLMGDAVNVAARLTAQSLPDQPLVSHELLARTSRRFVTTGARRLSLKNRHEPVTAAVLGRPRADTGPEQATTGLVGREAELSAVRDVVQRGGALVVSGEPGVGKSRLMLHAEQHPGGRRVVRVAGHPYGTSSPYAPYAGLVGRVVRDAAGIADESIRRTWLHSEVVRGLADGPPLLLIAEDIHWFDQASLDLTSELAAAAADSGWAVLATTRPGAPAPEGMRCVSVAPLTVDAATHLAIDLAGDVAMTDFELADLVRRSGGNPLFLRELVTAAATQGELSDTVEQILGARIDELDPDDRRLLREAAVAGHDADVRVLDTVLDDGRASDPQRWRPLRGLVSVESGRVHFDHDLVRAVAYAGLPYRRRRELHGALADILAREDGSYAAVVARHYTVAERHADSWTWSRRAAAQARETAAWVEAADLYVSALRASDLMQPRPPMGDVAAVAEAMGDVCERLGRTDDARRSYRRALAVAQDARGLSRIRRKQARVEERAGRFLSAFRLYADALRALDDAGPEADDDRAAAQLGQSFIRWQQGRFEDARVLAQRALELAEAGNAQAQMAQAHLQLEMACGELGLPGRAEHADAALRIFAASGDDLGLANMLLNLGVSAYNESDWATSLDYYQRAADAYRRAGDIIGEAVILNNRAEILTDQGRLDEASQCLDDARRVFRATRYEIGVAATTSARSRIALRRGDVESAVQLNAQAREEFTRLGAQELVVDADARHAELLAHFGGPEDAVAGCLQAKEELDTLGGLPVVATASRRYLAVALARAGRADEAVAAIVDALEHARGGRIQHEVALGLTVQAWLDGTEPPREAADICHRLGIIELPELPALSPGLVQ